MCSRKECAIAAATGGNRLGPTTVACGGPDDAHYGGHCVGFDEFDLQLVVVDLVGRQRGDGLIGHGLDSFTVGFQPSVVLTTPLGALDDLVIG